ncbi:MAG TPA: hypothetical protein VGN12_13055 [Pirellulales bacterium]|jgi:hypothetical protein
MSSSRWIVVAALAVVVGVSSITVASAQQRGRGGAGGRGMGMAPGADVLMMLTLEPVQKELKLTDAQTTTVREAGEQMQSEMRETFSGLQDLSQEERREKMQELRGEIEKKVKELRAKVDTTLDASQKDRLKQLVLQRRGVLQSLQDAEVATSLKLTDEQKKKVETLVAESRPGRGQGGAAAAGDGDRAAMRERFAAMQKERNEKALGILTAEQKSEFEKLQGAKFDFPAGRGGGFLPGA